MDVASYKGSTALIPYRQQKNLSPETPDTGYSQASKDLVKATKPPKSKYSSNDRASKINYHSADRSSSSRKFRLLKQSDKGQFAIEQYLANTHSNHPISSHAANLAGISVYA